MYKLNFVIICAALVVYLFGCDEERGLTTPQPGENSATISIYVGEIWPEEVFVMPFHSNPVELSFLDDYEVINSDAYIDGWMLYFRLGHGGGCKTHTYSLKLNRVDNQTAYIFVDHNGNGDTCEAYLQNNFKADLREILVRDDFSDIILLQPNGTEILVSRGN